MRKLIALMLVIVITTTMVSVVRMLPEEEAAAKLKPAFYMGNLQTGLAISLNADDIYGSASTRKFEYTGWLFMTERVDLTRKMTL